MGLDQPLAGVRVLDFTRLIPGAFCTLMLAEMGAEIIKVEDPRGGDPTRALPPQINGRGLYDLLLNRGKKSVALDLRDATSAHAIDRLVATSDIVIESFRPGTARKFGVSGEQIRARHPHVIHCAITGYGQTGPYAERPGHDLNYVAVSGILAADRPALSRVEGPALSRVEGPALSRVEGPDLSGFERPNPSELPRMFIADVGGGAMSAVIAILAALFGRTRTGMGATLDISMHDAALYWMMLPAARDLIDAGANAVGELPTFGDHACYGVYRTLDNEAIAVGALEPKFWIAFCESIGRTDLVERHLTDAVDQQSLIAEVRTIIASRSRADWLAFFDAHDVCVSPVNHPAEALVDPHIIARGRVVQGPGLRTVVPPFLRSVPDLTPAPEVGQHTREILG